MRPRARSRWFSLALALACASALVGSSPAAAERSRAARADGNARRPADTKKAPREKARRPAARRPVPRATSRPRLFERKAASRLAARQNPILRHSWRELRGLDRLVARIHRDAPDRAHVQLTGSSLYVAIGALERGQQPAFSDVDLRIYGVTAARVVEMVRAEFPNVDPARDVQQGSPYAPEVSHVQIDIPRERGPPMQLDLSIYEPRPGDRGSPLDRPHQWVSFAKLKLDVARGQRLTDLLHAVSTYRGASATRALRDPGRSGVKDLTANKIRVVQEPGMDRSRLPEGLLHAMYLVGRQSHLEVHRGTIRLYRRMPARSLRAFFDRRVAGDELARVRAGYILSAFRPDESRVVRRALELGRETGFWGKVLPGMGAIARDPARWRASVDAAIAAQQQATADPNKSRAWVFGAFLRELPDRPAVDRALSTLTLPHGDRPDLSYRQEALAAWEHHRSAAP